MTRAGIKRPSTNCEAEADRAQVQLENARREADRAAQLLANKAISTEEADARVARFQEAKAALLAAQAARDSREARPRIHAGARAD